MAEVAIELLLKQAAIVITGEVNLYRNSKKEAKDLVKNLKKIKMILDDAERKQMRKPLVKSWLEDLQDVAYDVEDALDIWEAKRAEAVATVPSNVENEVKKDDDESLLKKVRFFVQSLSSCCKGVVEHRTVALEIKELNENIEKMYDMGSKLKLINQTPTSESQKKPDPNDRITSSVFVESEVFGREEDKKTVKDMLLSFDNEKENETIPVVSIVGAGGLGKTTLAKLVYKEVESKFSKRIWVCVSDPFDQITVAKQILEQLGNPSSNVSGLDKLIQLIQTSLKDSKFLLVLDDVWVEERSKWDELNACLSPGVKGSVILVTTRKLNTAQVVFRCDGRCIHDLKQVDDKVCWAIIGKIAGKIDIQLEEIGKKLAKKCAGSPLAAQVLGGLLRKKKNVEDWQRILDNEIWQLKNVKEELFHHFFLSYDELDPAAKRCFSFCAVFPKDFDINVEELIRMWMAQGFLSDRDGQMEVEGRWIFDDLSQRSFFQDFQKDASFWFDSDLVVGCKMHDIVHDFAQFLTKDECVVVSSRSVNEIALEKTRHLSWLEKDNPEITLVSGAAKLRTFLCVKSLTSNFLKHLKCVRELRLYLCGLKEIPEEIGNLIHLRYLDLSYNDIRVIPQGICNLSKLQTLDLNGFNNNILEIPKEMGRLVKLRHFSMQNLILFAGLEGLHDLHTLNGNITIRKWGDENKLGRLAELNQLEGHLEIGFDVEITLDDVEEAKKAALIHKKSLRSLSLLFYYSDDIVEKMVEALQPNPELICLELKYTALPKWITSMTNLRKLKLYHVSLNELSSLWKLPSLETLYIDCGDGEKLGREFLGLKKGDDASTSSGNHVINEKQSIIVAFPSLKKLSFDWCSYWIKWEDISEEEEANNPTINIIMPQLTLLEFNNSPSLKELPHRLLRRLAAASSLKTLKCWECPGVKEYYDGKSTEQVRSKASHIPNIQIVYEQY